MNPLDERQDKFKVRLKLLEGESRNHRGWHRAYLCPAGHLTVGFGHNLENGVSDRVAELLLDDDILDVENLLDARIPWWRDAPEPAQTVLKDMMFNMGWEPMPGRGLSSLATLLQLMHDREYEQAAVLMWNPALPRSRQRWKYSRDVGARAQANADLLRLASDEEDKEPATEKVR